MPKASSELRRASSELRSAATIHDALLAVIMQGRKCHLRRSCCFSGVLPLLLATLILNSEHLHARRDRRHAPLLVAQVSVRASLNGTGVLLLLLLLPHAQADCLIAPDENGHVDYPAGERTSAHSFSRVGTQRRTRL